MYLSGKPALEVRSGAEYACALLKFLILQSCVSRRAQPFGFELLEWIVKQRVFERLFAEMWTACRVPHDVGFCNVF